MLKCKHRMSLIAIHGRKFWKDGDIWRLGKGSWADGQCEGIWEFPQAEGYNGCSLFTLWIQLYSKKNTAIFQCHLSFHILRSLQPQQKLLGKLMEFTVWWDNSRPILTAVRVVPYDVVSPAPVPEQKGGIARPRHNVAVPTNVRLRPGQARHHVPVAKYNLS